MESKRLEGKVLLVSGAAQGIGQGIALRASKEGAAVVLGDLQDRDETLKGILDGGGEARRLVMDVRVADDWRRAVAETRSAYGRIDLLANVAGIVNKQSPDTIVELTESAWSEVIDTDLKGVWLGMQAAIPAMIEGGGGRIVNISSMAAVRGLPNLASYTAAKGGVAALTRQAAMEYASRNILVNAIAPGTIDTPILGDITPEMRDAFADAHAIKRLGTPEDIAAMATYFFSDDGSFQTGLLVPVDGGWSVI